MSSISSNNSLRLYAKWHKDEVSQILSTLKLPSIFQKYTQGKKIQILQKIKEITKSTKTVIQIKNKLSEIEKSYRKAKDQSRQTGWGLVEGDFEKTVQGIVFRNTVTKNMSLV